MFTRRECRNLASRNPPDWQKFTVQFMTIVEENLEFGYVKLVIVKEIHFWLLCGLRNVLDFTSWIVLIDKFTVHFFSMIDENLKICHLKLPVLKRIHLSLIHHGWRKFWNLASCNPPDWQNFTSLYTAIDWENFDFLYGTVRNFSYPPKTAGKIFVPPQNDHWNFHTPPLSPPPPHPAIKMTTP